MNERSSPLPFNCSFATFRSAARGLVSTLIMPQTSPTLADSIRDYLFGWRNGNLVSLLGAVEQSSAAVIVTNAHGSIEYVNPRFEELSGYCAADVLWKNPRMFRSDAHDQDFHRSLWSRISNGDPWRGELCNRRKNGELYWVESTIAPVQNSQGRITHFVSVSQDITRRKQVEDDLHRSCRELQTTDAQLQQMQSLTRELTLRAASADRAANAFLASMSHELRTPLNVIIGLASMLSDKTRQNDVPEASRLILESGQSLLTSIEGILDYTMVQAGKARLEPKQFPLQSLVMQCLRTAGGLAAPKGLSLSYWISPNVPAVAFGDQRRIQQIVLSLLSNAVKYTTRGNIHLGIGARRHGGDGVSLAFSVVDTGPGINREDMPRLFEPFHRLSESGDIAGAGLGLAVSRAYARLMGGDITVRSRPGTGSAFRCTVRVRTAPDEPSLLARLAPPGLRGLHLHLIDPSPRRLRLLRAAAHAWQMRVVSASGTPAPEKWASDPAAFAIIAGDAPPACPVPHVRIGAPAGGDAPARFSRTLPSSPLDLSECARALSGLLEERHALTSPAGSSSLLPARRLPLRILAADDIRLNREVLRRMLQHLGYECDMVENGAEVLEQLKHRSYDLVLLDVQMPVLDGLATARAITNLYSSKGARPRMAAITANALSGDREKCLAAGMDDYLSKPVRPRDIEACLLRLFPALRPVDRAATPVPIPPLPYHNATSAETITPCPRP